jgi:hypothetical protein
MATTTTHETYGVPVTLSVIKGITSKRKGRAGFSYPLIEPLDNTIPAGTPPKNTSQSNYFNKSYGVELIRNNLRQLLLTQRGERVMLPEFGLDLRRYLFQPLDETLYHLIKRDILLTLSTYFSIAKPLVIKVGSDDRETENSTLRVELTLQLLDESLDIFDIEVRLG